MLIKHTCICVKADSCMEALAVFEDIEGECDLNALPLLLDAEECTLQIQPEADLLQSCPRGWVAVKLGHLWSRIRVWSKKRKKNMDRSKKFK